MVTWMVEAVLVGTAGEVRLIRTLILVNTLIKPVTNVPIFAVALFVRVSIVTVGASALVTTYF